MNPQWVMGKVCHQLKVKMTSPEQFYKLTGLLLILLLTCLKLNSQNLCKVGILLKDSISNEVIPNEHLTVNTQPYKTDSLGMLYIGFMPGYHDIRLNCQGYRPCILRLNINADTGLTVTLSRKIQTLAAYSIRSSGSVSKQVLLNSNDPGKLELSMKDLKKIPSMGGEPDLLKAVQLSPGIKRGSEGSIGIYVRGGGADQNLILMDDAVIYNAGHLLGFFSIFNTASIQGMAVYKSGFSPAYGGRLSSVLDIRSRDGNFRKTEAELTLSTIAAGFTVQGPVRKNKSSFIISARRSYIDRTFNMVGKELPMFFYDLNSRLSFKIGMKDKISLTTYLGRDVLNWDGKFNVKDSSSRFSSLHNLKLRTNSDMGNFVNSLRWEHSRSKKAPALTLTLYNSAFNYAVSGNISKASVKVKSSIMDQGLKLQVRRPLKGNNILVYGFSSSFRMFKPKHVESSGDASVQTDKQKNVILNDFEQAVFAQGSHQFTDRISSTFGLRYSALSLVSGETFNGFEPRINVQMDIDSLSKIKLSLSRMKQYLHLISGSSVALPTDIWYPATQFAPPEIADQISLGYHRDFPGQSFSFSSELYYKSMKNLCELKEGISILSTNEYEKDIYIGRGIAYGYEMMLNYSRGKFSGFAAYTLAWSKRQFDSINQAQKFYSKYDRRHEISVFGNYQINSKLSFSFTWLYSGGSPFTALTGRYLSLTPSQDDITTLPVYSEKNAYRLSASHRLDLDLGYKFKSKGKAVHELHLSTYNTYNRTQASWIEVGKDDSGNLQYQQKGLFGFIPAFSYRLKI